MGGRESWDAWNSPNNELLTEILGAGAAVTGLGFRQVVISTVPDTGSWRWDAVTAFSSSHADSYIIELAPGAGDGPGTGTYDSGGILLLQDVPEPFGPLPPLPVGDDGQLFIQLFEDPDDLENAIDANYTAGSYDVAYIAGAPVPAASSAFLLGLALTLTLVGIWRISTTRRRGSATPEI
jgi:hypothetical protein